MIVESLKTRLGFSSMYLQMLYRDSVSVCSKSTPPAKLTKTVALPPLSHLQPGPGRKRMKSGEKTGAKTKKKKLSTKSSTGEDPMKIDCPAVVSRLLTQKSSHQRLVSDSYSETLSSPGGGSDRRHEREGKFLKRVGQIAKEERANKLRWLENSIHASSKYCVPQSIRKSCIACLEVTDMQISLCAAHKCQPFFVNPQYI